MLRSGGRLRLALWSCAASLLLIPLIAMQFSHEVQWDAADFAAGAGLIGLAGIGVESTVRLVRDPRSRLAWIGLVLLAAVLVWAELAVGIFD